MTTTDTTDTTTTTASNPTDPGPAVSPEVADAGTEPAVTEPVETDRAGKEAARYRRQLRDTEAERDTFRAERDAARRALVDRLAEEEGKVRPGGLWASGVELEALLDEAGNVDVTLVREACAAAAESLGLQRLGIPRPDPSQGMGGGGGASSGWQAAFAPSSRRG